MMPSTRQLFLVCLRRLRGLSELRGQLVDKRRIKGVEDVGNDDPDGMSLAASETRRDPVVPVIQLPAGVENTITKLRANRRVAVHLVNRAFSTLSNDRSELNRRAVCPRYSFHTF